MAVQENPPDPQTRTNLQDKLPGNERTIMLRNVGTHRFSPRQLRILRPKNHLGKNVKLSVDEMVNEYEGVAALMAAPMFGHTGTGGCGKGGLTPCTRQLDTLTGVDFPSCRKKSGITFSVMPTGAVEVAMLDRVSPGAVLGLQGYPTLVDAGGRNVARRERVSSVAGLGWVPTTGEFLYAVGGGGTLRDLADLLLQEGCVAAGYCDAGSSAALWVRDRGWVGVHARNPRLPAWLAVVDD